MLHSRPARVLTSPLVAVPLFLVSLAGHTLMLLHFLVVGLLLFWPILAIDTKRVVSRRPCHLLPGRGQLHR